ncbi:hypothetical protein MKW98_018173 [Papaver atlanticum]|uniref:Uncharacterized protein n=1 Tax=Papaver atlanticum TaxID=357466 RepID=A0AAD4SCM1_9MAGN|nr:hypothetical protein MKW98_018173 [Papaver atlanticum]
MGVRPLTYVEDTSKCTSMTLQQLHYQHLENENLGILIINQGKKLFECRCESIRCWQRDNVDYVHDEIVTLELYSILIETVCSLMGCSASTKTRRDLVAWGFNIRIFEQQLTPLTWPEVLCLLAFSAVLGPLQKKSQTVIFFVMTTRYVWEFGLMQHLLFSMQYFELEKNHLVYGVIVKCNGLIFYSLMYSLHKNWNVFSVVMSCHVMPGHLKLKEERRYCLLTLIIRSCTEVIKLTVVYPTVCARCCLCYRLSDMGSALKDAVQAQLNLPCAKPRFRPAKNEQSAYFKFYKKVKPLTLNSVDIPCNKFCLQIWRIYNQGSTTPTSPRKRQYTGGFQYLFLSRVVNFDPRS